MKSYYLDSFYQINVYNDIISIDLDWNFMSDWPPKPQNEPITPKQNGPEWQILEKAVLASVEEQRRSRRWGIFFKTLTFIYLLFIVVLMGKVVRPAKKAQLQVVAVLIWLWLILLEPLMLQAINQ